jgi:hypothetical protein
MKLLAAPRKSVSLAAYFAYVTDQIRDTHRIQPRPIATVREFLHENRDIEITPCPIR